MRTGLRTAVDPLETAGMALSASAASQADLLVLVGEATAPQRPEFLELAERYPRALPIYNKVDLPHAVEKFISPSLGVSAQTGEGISELIAAIVARLVPVPPKPGEAIPFTPRQIAWLQQAADALPDQPQLALAGLQSLLSGEDPPPGA